MTNSHAGQNSIFPKHSDKKITILMTYVHHDDDLLGEDASKQPNEDF